MLFKIIYKKCRYLLNVILNSHWFPISIYASVPYLLDTRPISKFEYQPNHTAWGTTCSQEYSTVIDRLSEMTRHSTCSFRLLTLSCNKSQTHATTPTVTWLPGPSLFLTPGPSSKKDNTNALVSPRRRLIQLLMLFLQKDEISVFYLSYPAGKQCPVFSLFSVYTSTLFCLSCHSHCSLDNVASSYYRSGSTIQSFTSLSFVRKDWYHPYLLPDRLCLSKLATHRYHDTIPLLRLRRQ